MKFGCNRPSSFRGEVVWNCGRMTDGRTTDNGACLYYKLPRSLRLRWAKNVSICPLILLKSMGYDSNDKGTSFFNKNRLVLSCQKQDNGQPANDSHLIHSYRMSHWGRLILSELNKPISLLKELCLFGPAIFRFDQDLMTCCLRSLLLNRLSSGTYLTKTHVLLWCYHLVVSNLGLHLPMSMTCSTRP